MRLDVVLLEHVKNLGELGAVCSVRRGYANFLLRAKKALRANKENLAYFQEKKAVFEAQNKDRKTRALAHKKQFEDKMLYFIQPAGETGQLYGSVMARDILKHLTDAGIDSVTSSMVLLAKPIKTVGVHAFLLRLHPEVDIHMYIVAAKTKDEAAALEDNFRNPPKEPAQAQNAAPKAPRETVEATDTPSEEESSEKVEASKTDDASKVVPENA